MEDTIFALASAQGKAGVSIIRISGPHAWHAAKYLAGSLPPARKAGLRNLKDSQGRHLDQALVLCFQEDKSFTGEKTVELHLHGSTAVVSAVLRELGDIPDLRLADAGEFTRRALENGKLDLAQVEGLADLIDAETEAQRRQALRVLSGELGKKADSWRRDLIRAASLLEATIDFVDEDVPVDVSPEVTELLRRVTADLKAEMRGAAVAERIRTGFEVAILGAPNVGKSTLLNALAGRDAAITSEIAGTTRDVIEVRMDLEGIPVTLLDTAGIHETDDVVEGLGIEKARRRAEQADLRVFVIQDDMLPWMVPMPQDIVVRSKADLLGEVEGSISGLTGFGIDVLVKRITETLAAKSANVGLATRERHRLAITRAFDNLNAAAAVAQLGPNHYEIVAEELRSAVRALDVLVGRVDVEDLLDQIFSSFCIGK